MIFGTIVGDRHYQRDTMQIPFSILGCSGRVTYASGRSLCSSEEIQPCPLCSRFGKLSALSRQRARRLQESRGQVKSCLAADQISVPCITDRQRMRSWQCARFRGSRQMPSSEAWTYRDRLRVPTFQLDAAHRKLLMTTGVSGSRHSCTTPQRPWHERQSLLC